MSSNLQVVIRDKNAKTPYRADEGSAGYDIYSIEEVTIHPNKRNKVRTGISITVPTGTYGRIAPRSSLALKGIDVCAGVVDRSYTGEVMVVLHNTGDEPYTVRVGDKIAQLLLEFISTPCVNIVEELEETKRGDGGFGSTGR